MCFAASLHCEEFIGYFCLKACNETIQIKSYFCKEKENHLKIRVVSVVNKCNGYPLFITYCDMIGEWL